MLASFTEESLISYIPLLSAVITFLGGLQLLFLKWLINHFDKISQSFKELSAALTKQQQQMHDWLMDHEEKDMLRHEDNLRRFEAIHITLAKI